MILHETTDTIFKIAKAWNDKIRRKYSNKIKYTTKMQQ